MRDEGKKETQIFKVDPRFPKSRWDACGASAQFLPERCSLIILIHFRLQPTSGVETLPHTDTSPAVIIQADARKTEWFRGKWEIFWQSHFIVLAVNGQQSVTKACKYMRHLGFYESDLRSDGATSIKKSMWRDPDSSKCSGDLSLGKVSRRSLL